MLPKPYDDYVRYTGPYVIADEHLRMTMKLIDKTGKRKTMLYHRYLIEVKLGRLLNEDEIVHHKDGNSLNNGLDNLEVMNTGDHIRLHKPIQSEGFVCPECNKKFALVGQQLKNMKQKKRLGLVRSGPYCSKSCSSSRR